MNKFLKEFLPICNLPIYLETNATLPQNLMQIIDYISYVSADIKLPSATGLEPQWDKHDKFFEIANKKNLYAKVVFDSKITDDEIENVCNLAKLWYNTLEKGVGKKKFPLLLFVGGGHERTN